MSFFSETPEENYPQIEHSKQLFQQPFSSPDTDNHVSLSAYISKHLQGGEQKEEQNIQPGSFLTSPPPRNI